MCSPFWVFSSSGMQVSLPSFHAGFTHLLTFVWDLFLAARTQLSQSFCFCCVYA